MGYEIQKLILIPINCSMTFAEGESPYTTEVWQPLASAYNLKEGLEKLQRFREFNKGRGLIYRLIKTISEKNPNEGS